MKLEIAKITVIINIFMTLIAFCANSTTQAIAHRDININQIRVHNNTQKQIPSPPDTGTDTGPQSGGGATRPINSKCPNTNRLITALMPRDLKLVTESPNFWFYIPYKAENVDSLSFTILDEKNQVIQPNRRIPLADTPGFIKFRLPTRYPSLELGKRYRWYFSVYCDPQNNEDRISFQGVMERVNVSSNFLQNIENLSPLDKVAYYLNHNYKYDAFNLLAQLYQNDLNNLQITAQWKSFFDSYNLNSLDSEPILSCCSLESPESLE